MNKRRRYKAKARRAQARHYRDLVALPLTVFERFDPDEIAEALGAERVPQDDIRAVRARMLATVATGRSARSSNG